MQYPFRSSVWMVLQPAEDALEFIMAGATAVSVGTANFFNPYATVKIAEGIQAFLEKNRKWKTSMN